MIEALDAVASERTNEALAVVVVLLVVVPGVVVAVAGGDKCSITTDPP